MVLVNRNIQVNLRHFPKIGEINKWLVHLVQHSTLYHGVQPMYATTNFISWGQTNVCNNQFYIMGSNLCMQHSILYHGVKPIYAINNFMSWGQTNACQSVP